MSIKKPAYGNHSLISPSNLSQGQPVTWVLLYCGRGGGTGQYSIGLPYRIGWPDFMITRDGATILRPAIAGGIKIISGWTTDVWYHLAVSADDSDSPERRYYRDGSQITSDSSASVSSRSALFNFGATSYSEAGFAVEEFGIYSRKLSAGEINDIYIRGFRRSGNYSGLQYYWPLMSFDNSSTKKVSNSIDSTKYLSDNTGSIVEDEIIASRRRRRAA